MLSSSSNTLVVAVEVDSLPGSKSSSPLLPEKLGILQKIPGRTSVIPENQGNNTGFSPPKARYQDDGAQLIIDTAAGAVETLRSLPAGQKETFAFGFYNLTSKLQAKTGEMVASRRAIPAELPDPLP